MQLYQKAKHKHAKRSVHDIAKHNLTYLAMGCLPTLTENGCCLGIHKAAHINKERHGMPKACRMLTMPLSILSVHKPTNDLARNLHGLRYTLGMRSSDQAESNHVDDQSEKIKNCHSIRFKCHQEQKRTPTSND